MNVLRIDHTAIAVHELNAAVGHFVNTMGAVKIMQMPIPAVGYSVAYLKWGTDIITVISPDSPENFVNKDLARRGEGLHHMGIEVADLAEAEKYFTEHGGKVHHYGGVEGVRKEFVVAPKGNCGILLQVMCYEEPYRSYSSSAERYMDLHAKGVLGG